MNNIVNDSPGGNSDVMGNVTAFSGTNTINYNNFFGYSAPTAQSNAVIGDPLFVNIASDWHLQTGSPGIRKGTVVTAAACVEIRSHCNPIR